MDNSETTKNIMEKIAVIYYEHQLKNNLTTCTNLEEYKETMDPLTKSITEMGIMGVLNNKLLNAHYLELFVIKFLEFYIQIKKENDLSESSFEN